MENSFQTAASQLSRDAIVDLTRRLIRIESVNPPGGEGPVAGELAGLLASHGVDVRLSDVKPGRPNLVATIGSGREPHLAMIGHMDVVAVGERENWSADPFSAEMRGGRIIGRGASDMKGGLATMTSALLAIHKSGLSLQGTLSLAAVMGEETGAEGSRALVEDGFHPSAVITGEATTATAIGIGYRGCLWLEVTTFGSTSHGSRPNLGTNAILHMTEYVIPAVVSVVEGFTKRPAPGFLIDRATVAVGMITGGLQVNVVPDRCAAAFDIRMVPGERPADIKDAIEESLLHIQSSVPSLRWKIRELHALSPFVTDHHSVLVQHLSSAISETTGQEPRLMGKTGFSDANVFAEQLGIPAVAFGPGEIDSGHSPDEWVGVSNLFAVSEVLVRTALDFCGVS